MPTSLWDLLGSAVRHDSSDVAGPFLVGPGSHLLPLPRQLPLLLQLPPRLLPLADCRYRYCGCLLLLRCKRELDS